jgi:hypothetical protein
MSWLISLQRWRSMKGYRMQEAGEQDQNADHELIWSPGIPVHGSKGRKLHFKAYSVNNSGEPLTSLLNGNLTEASPHY